MRLDARRFAGGLPGKDAAMVLFSSRKARASGRLMRTVARNSECLLREGGVAVGFSLIQYRSAEGKRQVAALDETGRAMRVDAAPTIYSLAEMAISRGESLTKVVYGAGSGEFVDLEALVREGRLLAPIEHEEPSRLFLTGTGLTHLGSAKGRDAMHRQEKDAAAQSDSMKMFMMGLEGGKPAENKPGVQPEWFYKGNGSCIAAPGGAIHSPAFALDAGEEAELAGIYLIGPGGIPVRIGFCLANEFSDHVTERTNYLWLAHSKLRQAALGPEIYIGPLPDHVEGRVRILRDHSVLWEKPFLSGEANMSHSFENLEQHHFKYAMFRRPGDIHVHFFGTATLSFSDGVRAQTGDVFEIEASPFRLPLRNVLAVDAGEEIEIRRL